MLLKTGGVISSTTITRMTVILLSSKNMHVHVQLVIKWCILVLWLPFIQAEFQFTLKCQSDSNDDTFYLVCTCQDSNPQLESRLDEIERFFPPTAHSHLSINVTNCSKLLITSYFSKLWREGYAGLKLTLSNIEEIRHERPPLQDFQIMSAILITFSVSNSSIETLFPGLVSHTETLNFKLTNCNVKELAANAFQSVNALQSFHIDSSNIETWSSAMPGIVTMQSLPDATTDQYIQLTGSTIKSMDAHALAIRTNSDEYFTISKTLIETLQDSAIQVHGLGHVVILDSNITEANSDESFTVDFKGPVTSDQILSSVTIVNSHFHQSSFLHRWQVTNGPIVFMQSSFQDQTLVDMAKFLDKPNANVNIQETTLLCDCESLDPFLNPLKNTDHAKAIKESEETITELSERTTNETLTTITTVAEFTVDTSASGEPNSTTETQHVGDTSSTTFATTTSTSTSTGQPSEPDQYDIIVPPGDARLTADALIRTKRNKEDKLYNLISTGQCLPSQNDQRLSQYYFGQCNTAADSIFNRPDLHLLLEKIPSKSLQTALLYSTVGVGCLLVTLIGTAFVRFLVNRSKKGILKVTSRRQAKMGVVSEEPIYEDEEEC